MRNVTYFVDQGNINHKCVQKFLQELTTDQSCEHTYAVSLAAQSSHIREIAAVPRTWRGSCTGGALVQHAKEVASPVTGPSVSGHQPTRLVLSQDTRSVSTSTDTQAQLHVDDARVMMASASS